MSFMEKVGSLMRRPGEDAVPKDEVPWWMKYLGRGLGTVGGGIAIFLGVWNCLGILTADVSCLVSGMWQMVAGFTTIVIEAPCCCLFIDFVQHLSEWVDKKPYWNRAVFYCGISIPPFLFCIGLSSFLGSGLIFATGVVYGMMSLGKKASREEMQANMAAQQQQHHQFNQQQQQQQSSQGAKSNLVENAAPMGNSKAAVPPV
uniref:Calcium channel flower n=1 Tax=Triatoma dimidiata TaxID=72491 RepID=A0A0V0G7P7_TRIDM